MKVKKKQTKKEMQGDTNVKVVEHNGTRWKIETENSKNKNDYFLNLGSLFGGGGFDWGGLFDRGTSILLRFS